MSDVLTYRCNDWHGGSLLHAICWNMRSQCTRNTVEEAINLGFELNTRDRKGDTPLGAFMEFSGTTMNSTDFLHWVVAEQEVVVTLLQNGADPNAWHESLCNFIPYKTGYIDTSRIRNADFGSYRGDLWDSCLSLCSYEINLFRLQGPRRRALYTSAYRRSHFELLWKGREYLCPYWDDQVWPALEEWASDYHRACRGDPGNISSESLDEMYRATHHYTQLDRKNIHSASEEEYGSYSDEGEDKDDEEYLSDEEEGMERLEDSDQEDDGGARL
jgi:hypothetical protein